MCLSDYESTHTYIPYSLTGQRGDVNQSDKLDDKSTQMS